MTARMNLDQIARALAARSNRRTLLKGSAAVAATGGAAAAIGTRTSGAAAQDAAKLSFWFDTTGGAETAQILNYLRATSNPIGLLLNFGSKGKLEWERLAGPSCPS